MFTAFSIVQYQAFDLIVGGLLGIGADSTLDDAEGIAYVHFPYTDGLALVLFFHGGSFPTR